MAQALGGGAQPNVAWPERANAVLAAVFHVRSISLRPVPARRITVRSWENDMTMVLRPAEAPLMTVQPSGWPSPDGCSHAVIGTGTFVFVSA
ncbi:hypothetical protein [Microvirga massiliensis]|uniref:hypothetical protein n=1 Tax=Microvirga massiliensis TaxID=1033741 RepID=UPI000AC76133|nr:hypothetical protein [Microvirga massiliensis]